MSGVGAALQQIGGSIAQWGMGQYQRKQDMAAAEKASVREEEIWRARQEFLARLQAPPERERQVYDTQKQMAMRVREQLVIGGDASQGPPAPTRWQETGREEIPVAPEMKTIRQGDEEVTVLINPQTGDIMREVGRGNAYSPSQRRARGGGGGGEDGEGGGAAGSGEKPKFKASDFVIENGVRVNKIDGTEAPLQLVQQSIRETEEAKARGQNAQTIIEKAEAAQQQLAILDRMTELQKTTRTGPIAQYSQPSWGPDGGYSQEYDAQATKLLGPTLRAMFGANPTEGERKSASGALPSRDKDEPVNQKLIEQMREQAMRHIEAAKALKAGGPSGSAPEQPQGKTIKRTGLDKKTGRKIIEYSDGTVEYAS